MDKSTFETVDPLIDEIAELTDKVLASDELARLRKALTRLGATLDEQYAVNLSVVVDISDHSDDFAPVEISRISRADPLTQSARRAVPVLLWCWLPGCGSARDRRSPT